MKYFFADDQKVIFCGINFCESSKKAAFCGIRVKSAKINSAIINSFKVVHFVNANITETNSKQEKR